MALKVPVLPVSSVRTLSWPGATAGGFSRDDVRLLVQVLASVVEQVLRPLVGIRTESLVAPDDADVSAGRPQALDLVQAVPSGSVPGGSPGLLSG